MQAYEKKSNRKELFKIVDDFVKEKIIKWSDCVGLCTEADCVMVGNKGLQAII
jgi:hypothetical protein